MEILSSGSFVNLDNRTQIEQLIFTAKELAAVASRTDGFVGGADTNQKLALEMWRGAEYVCRDNEEATIKNIFLSNFLQKLKEVTKPISPAVSFDSEPSRPGSLHPPVPAPISSHPPVEQQVTEVIVEQKPDLVIELDEAESASRSSDADECLPECDADIEALVERLDNEPDGVEKESELLPNEASADTPVTKEPSSTVFESGSLATAESSSPDEIVRTEDRPDEKAFSESESISSIVIPEKEPYNFDSCAVTAVVQLLPEADGVRKCVVSVRTHDFTPRVTIVDVPAADGLPQISAALGQAFEQYRNELPARAADKVNKEKPAAKKGSKSTAKTTKPEASAAKPDTAPAASAEAAADQNQQGLFAA